MKKYFLLSFIVILTSCSLIQFGGYNPPPKVDILTNSSYNWEKDSSEHFYFYFESESISKNYVDSAKIIFERNYPELLQFLEVTYYRNKLNLFMIDSRNKMKEIVGMETNGIARIEDNTVYSIFNNEIKTYGNHEFCHIICCNEWGMYKEQWLSEGLAVSSDKKWWDYELHRLANYLNAKKKLVPIKEIINNFHNYNSLITYPEVGSFTLFIKEKYGMKLVKELWKEGNEVFETKLDKNIQEIEQEWLSEIDKYDYSSINYEDKVKKVLHTSL